MTKPRAVWLLALILTGAMALKAVLLACDSVPFNGDEAIVALMARHILQGERPLFFYGQHYMGSLDAYLVAGAFALLGESVLTVRVVQIALFAATLVTSCFVAQRITGSTETALLTVLLLAFPPVLLTLYTTASLGGYGEALLAGNLLLWWGHRAGHEDRERWGRWLTWGLIAGLGFWSMALVMVYAVPVALWLLGGLSRPADQKTPSPVSFRFPRLAVAAVGFLVGSLPWWLGGGAMDVAALLRTEIQQSVTLVGFAGNLGERALYFVGLGLPVLFGLRFPWSVEGPSPWLGVPALALYLGGLSYAVHRWRTDTHSERLLLWGVWGTLFLGFVLSPYGRDPSGRYFLPLYLPLSIFTADALTALRMRVGRWAWAPLAALLVFNLAGTAQAALDNPPGITTQFDPITQVDHRSYGELISFLHEHRATRGYANYWIAYPLAFLSHEEIILVPRLPYKADLRYTRGDDRYEPYDAIVEASPTVAYVTSHHPALDALLQERFAELGISFQEKQISSYHIFYDLSGKVTPEELSIRPTK